MQIELTPRQMYACFRKTKSKGATTKEFLGDEPLSSLFDSTLFDEIGKEEYQKLRKEWGDISTRIEEASTPKPKTKKPQPKQKPKQKQTVKDKSYPEIGVWRATD